MQGQTFFGNLGKNNTPIYETQYRSPFLVHDDGTNALYNHQRIISRLTVELGILYDHKQTMPFVPLPETPLAEGPGYPVPDGTLYDENIEQTRVIIEVRNNRSVNSDLRKMIRLIEEDDFGIQEGFVFNYVTREWLHYRKGDGAVRRGYGFVVFGVNER